MNVKHERKFYLIGSIIILITATCLLILNCKDPPEYTDELVPPPDPPTFTSPFPDTTYNGDIVYVLFDWETIYQAQCYEICVDTLSTFETSFIIRVENPPVTEKMERGEGFTTYYYKIRAGSRRWTYYTDWSETRKFYIKPEG